MIFTKKVFSCKPFDARLAGMDERLVLEEIQMPPCSFRGVICRHRFPAPVYRTCESSALFESDIDMKLQLSVFCFPEINLFNLPGLAQIPIF